MPHILYLLSLSVLYLTFYSLLFSLFLLFLSFFLFVLIVYGLSLAVSLRRFADDCCVTAAVVAGPRPPSTPQEAKVVGMGDSAVCRSTAKGVVELDIANDLGSTAKGEGLHTIFISVSFV